MTDLIIWDNARRAIEEARSIDEIKDIRDKAEALRLYSKQAGESLEVQNAVAEIKIRAERKAGEILSDLALNERKFEHVQAMSSDTTSAPPKLSDMGISRDQSSKWQQIATIPEPTFERHIVDTKAAGDELTTAGVLRVAKSNHNTRAVTSSDSNEWYTPEAYIETARRVMGDFDLDPASSEYANQTVKAAYYYTKDDNGLDQDWCGRVWLNPPYGKDGPLFIAKLLEEYEAGNVTEAIILVNSNSTETNWFSPLWNYMLCFTNHRINFFSPTGSKNGSTHGSVFIYLGSNEKEFAKQFKPLGYVVKQVNYEH